MEDIWYSGLRVAKGRTLTEVDRETLSRLRRDRKKRFWMSFAVPAAVFTLGWVACFIFDSYDIVRLTTPVAVVLAFSFRPWRTAAVFQRQIEELERDEIGAEVLICEGVGGDLVFEQDEEHRLQPAVLVRGPQDEPLTVELLPHSGAILSVNGTRMRTWNAVRKGTTVAKSDHARAAADFVEPDQAGYVAIGERPMSAEELNELLGHAPELSRLDILFATSVAALAFVSWWHAFAARTPTLLIPVVSFICAIWLGSRAFRRWRAHRLFARDIGHRRVFIIRTMEEGVASGPPVEYLPFSGALWSVDHNPATWRRLPLARRTYVRRG